MSPPIYKLYIVLVKIVSDNTNYVGLIETLQKLVSIVCNSFGRENESVKCGGASRYPFRVVGFYYAGIYDVLQLIFRIE